jgi:hypothetical protein
MTGPRVLLMRLSIRESARGTEYLSGFLGAARVVAFKAKEPDRYGNEQWEVYVAEPEPKDKNGQRRDLPVKRQSTWDRARDHGLLTGETRAHKAERRDPRQEHIEDLARRFDERPPDEVPF